MLHRTQTLNGPDLDLLGRREPGIYGRTTLAASATMGHAIACRQSNDEGQRVSRVEAIPGRSGGPILNAGASGHSLIALLDALRARKEPLIEVHLSNIYRRETFRQHSYVSLGRRA